MLRLRILALGLPVVGLFQCGPGAQPGDDGGPGDAGKDGYSLDSGKDTGLDAGKDVASDVTTDVTNDVALDSPADSTTDASDGSVTDTKSDTSTDGGVIASISGLVLWLDANKGVTTSGSDISTWADQSTQGNDASAGSSTPTLASSSINSLPAAHFVASSQQYISIADATSLEWGTGDYFVAVVAKFDNDPTGGITSGVGSLYTKIGVSSGVVFFANSYDITAATFDKGLTNLEDTTTDLTYAASYNDGTARLYAVERASGTETLRVNGTQVASGSSSVDVSESGVDVFIGSGFASTKTLLASLDGDIAEIIAVKGTLGGADLSTIETYLKTKYGL